MKTILKKAKRTLSLLLVLLMVVPMTVSLAVPASAAETVKYEVEGGYIYFDHSTGTITDCDSSVTKAEVPSEINGVAVTSIGKKAFCECNSLESIVIPNSVTSIGMMAFCYCESLESITIPEGITSIDDGVFYDCKALKSIAIPDSVTSIGSIAFGRCTSLESIIIPDGVTSIGDNETFSGCTSLQSITIPDSVTSIGDHTFSGCTSLESITIPDGVTSIGRGAFLKCTSLKTITIPDGVTSIGDYTFSYCDALESITIPDGVTSIGDHTFSGCTSLESITIPDGVTSIGNETFSDCTSLKSITIPNGVTSIGDQAFDNCESLETITIPDGVTSIGKWTFSTCKSLKSITIPNSVSSIGKGAFANCFSLESIAIPDGITTVSEWMLFGCGSLKSIIIPDGVTSIGERAFYSCDSLESITIPNSVTSIGEEAFYCYYYHDYNMEPYIYFKGDRKEWRNISKGENSIPDRIVVVYNDLCSLNGHSFGEWITVTEPTATLDGEEIRTCAICDEVETRIVSKTTVEYRVEGGNIYFDTLTGTVVDCDDSVTKANIPSKINGVKVTWIGADAFSNCKSLTSVTIPYGVTNIGIWAFSGCTSLKSITVPDSVTYIADHAFRDCTALTSVTLSKNYTGIANNLFNGCTALKSIVIPDGSTDIGDYAFSGCSSLTTVTIPGSVKGIWSGAFYGCNNLKNVYYCGSSYSWNRVTVDSNNQALNKATINYHKYGEWETIKNPSVSQSGERERQCSICKNIETEEIPKLSPENCVVSIEGKLPFEDVADGKWYTDGVKFCYVNGVVTGVTEYTFEPGTALTRGMFVVMLAGAVDADVSRYAGKSSFKDVKTTSWYANAVEWAYRNGYVSGMGEGYFSPKTNITRQQMCVLLEAYMTKNGYKVSVNKNALNKFTDANTISSWAKDGVVYTVSAGLMSGTTDTLISPKTELTRAQATTILMQFLKTYHYGEKCSHRNIIDATCTESAKCAGCGMKIGLPTGHYCGDLTCTTGSKCYECGKTVPASSGPHSFKAATCTAPAICKNCGLTKGSALGHKYKAATCTTPKTCTVCNLTSGGALGDNYAPASCKAPKKCKVCGITTGKALDHNFGSNGYCTMCGTSNDVLWSEEDARDLYRNADKLLELLEEAYEYAQKAATGGLGSETVFLQAAINRISSAEVYLVSSKRLLESNVDLDLTSSEYETLREFFAEIEEAFYSLMKYNITSDNAVSLNSEVRMKILDIQPMCIVFKKMANTLLNEF